MRFEIKVRLAGILKDMFPGLGKISRKYSFILNPEGLYITSFSPDRTAFVRLFFPRTSRVLDELDVEGEVAFEISDFKELLSAISSIDRRDPAWFRSGASPNTIEVKGFGFMETPRAVKVVPVPSESAKDLLSVNPAPGVYYDAYVVMDRESFGRIIEALYSVSGNHGRMVFTAPSPGVGRVVVSASRRVSDYTELEGEAELSPDKKTAYDVMVSRSAEATYDQKLLMGVVEAASYFGDKVTLRFGQNKPFRAIMENPVVGKMEVWIAPRGGRL